MKRLVLAATLAALIVPGGLAAQDEGAVIVTGSRVDRSSYDKYYDGGQSAIGLTRTADYFVKPLYVSSDSRDSTLREEELRTMLRATIARAPSTGIRLVAGDYTLRPVVDADADQLTVTGGNRPDTSRVLIYARIPVGENASSIKDADARIAAFIKAIPVSGRSFIETGETSLAINRPQQYRGEVVKAIADEGKRYAAMFGSDYGIEIRGLDSELFFNQASETEVFLFIEHNFVIRPK